MPDTITLTPSTGSAVVLTPIAGTVKVGGGHDDKGGGTIPAVRAGYACNGSFDVVLADTGTTLTAVMALPSEEGLGDYTVTGAGRYAGINAYQALIDVTIGGDSVQTASISWKGTYNPEEED